MSNQRSDRDTDSPPTRRRLVVWARRLGLGYLGANLLLVSCVNGIALPIVHTEVNLVVRDASGAREFPVSWASENCIGEKPGRVPDLEEFNTYFRPFRLREDGTIRWGAPTVAVWGIPMLIANPETPAPGTLWCRGCEPVDFVINEDVADSFSILGRYARGPNVALRSVLEAVCVPSEASTAERDRAVDQTPAE